MATKLPWRTRTIATLLWTQACILAGMAAVFLVAPYNPEYPTLKLWLNAGVPALLLWAYAWHRIARRTMLSASVKIVIAHYERAAGLTTTV